MNKDQAIKLAIKALEYQATEIYEGDEYNDSNVQSFVNEQCEAIKILETLR